MTKKNVTIVGYRGNIRKENEDIYLRKCIGNFQSNTGNIVGTEVSGFVITKTGKIDLSNCCDIKISNEKGNTFLENCKVENISTGGLVNLNNTHIKVFCGENLQGIGSQIDTLVLPQMKRNKITQNITFNLFNPNTWFNRTKQTLEELPVYNVPDGIIVKQIKTDRDVISKYPITILGQGKLIIQ